MSDMREPFDNLIPTDSVLSEETGKKLAGWAAGGLTEPEVDDRSSAPSNTDATGAGRRRAPASGSVSSWADLKAAAKTADLDVDLPALVAQRFPEAWAKHDPSEVTAEEWQEFWAELQQERLAV